MFSLKNYFILDKSKEAHLELYKPVMEELKGKSISKEKLITEILKNTPDDLTPQQVSVVIDHDSTRSQDLYSEISGIVKTLNVSKRVKDGVISDKNSFFLEMKENVSLLKSTLKTDSTESFVTKLNNFFFICDINTISQILDQSTISSVLVNLSFAKPLVLIVGIKTFLGVYNKYCTENLFFNNVLVNLKNNLVYKKIGLYTARLLTDRRFLYFSGACGIAIFVYSKNRNVLEIIETSHPEVPPLDIKNNELLEQSKALAAKAIKDRIDPIVLDPNGTPGMFLEAVRVTLGRGGYAVGQVVRAPVEGFYIGLFKPTIDFIYEILTKK